MIASLKEVISANQIKHLNLSHCFLGNNCTVVLTAIANSVTLQYLDLSYNDISNDETSCVASAITANQYLCYINISNNQFSHIGVAMIVKSMVATDFLQLIELSSYSLLDEVAADLEEVAVNNTGLKEVRIDEYHVQNVMKVHFPISISKLIVNKLFIKNHLFRDDEAIAMVSLINNSILICHIDLGYSMIPESKIYDIIRAMQRHSSLKFLNLNGVSIKGGIENELIYLIEQNTELQFVKLAECQLTDTFLSSLSVKLASIAPSHKELQHLNLSKNTMTSTATAQLKNLQCNLEALTHLEMVDCGLTSTYYF